MAIRQSAAQLISEFCQPYRRLGVTHFMHDITYGHGEITMLARSEALVAYYQRNAIPMLRTNDAGRVLEDGIYLNQILEHQYRDCALLMPLFERIGDKLGEHVGRNSVHIVAREMDCQHLYSIHSDLSTPDFLHWVVNNGQLLNDMVLEYNVQAKALVQEAKNPENRIVLPNSGELVHSLEQDHITIIHKTLNKPIQLSFQQNRCLSLLMKGKTAKEIGVTLELSTRTVEHYLEAVRLILGCKNNKALIIDYLDQFEG